MEKTNDLKFSIVNVQWFMYETLLLLAYVS
jgi:hypothetical protein